MTIQETVNEVAWMIRYRENPLVEAQGSDGVSIVGLAFHVDIGDDAAIYIEDAECEEHRIETSALKTLEVVEA